MRLRIRAARRPPANAAPTWTSGRSAGEGAEDEGDAETDPPAEAGPEPVTGGGAALVGVWSWSVLTYSGGSSPNARRQISAAAFVVAIEASAPSPASRPAQVRRLTRSLLMSRGVLSRRG